MNIIYDKILINIPNISTGGMDGIILFNRSKQQQYIGNVTQSNIKKKYTNISIKNKINYNNVLLYHSKFDINWRHFTMETFCSLKHFYRKNNLPNLKILVPKKHPKHVADIIKILDLQNDIIILKNYEEISIKNLIIPTVDIDFNFINFFIGKCKNKSTIKIEDKMKKIFFSRNHLNIKRPITNYEKFSKICLKNNKNIYPLIPENLFLADQVTLINNASKIISLIGASCDNIIFTNNNCKFVIICSNITYNWASSYKRADYHGGNKCIISNSGKLDLDKKKISEDKLNHPWIIDIPSIKKYFK